MFGGSECHVRGIVCSLAANGREGVGITSGGWKQAPRGTVQAIQALALVVALGVDAAVLALDRKLRLSISAETPDAEKTGDPSSTRSDLAADGREVWD